MCVHEHTYMYSAKKALKHLKENALQIVTDESQAIFNLTSFVLNYYDDDEFVSFDRVPKNFLPISSLHNGHNC